MNNKNTDELLEELQNQIGQIELQITRLLAEKSLLELQIHELLEENHGQS